MKKPKLYKKSFLSGQEVKNYISKKYPKHKASSEFWKWLFSECPWGETTLLPFDDDGAYGPEKFPDYIAIIEKEFKKFADEENCIEIENDL